MTWATAPSGRNFPLAVLLALLAVVPPLVPASVSIVTPTFAAAVTTPEFSAQWATTGKLTYRITYGEGGLEVGRLTHTWHHDGRNYSLRAVSEPVGIAAVMRAHRVVQESEGELFAGGLRPQRFRHQKKKGIETAVFDWDKHQVTLGDEPEPLHPGAQDMLSLYYQLALMSRAGDEFTLPVASSSRLADYIFRPVDSGSLEWHGRPVAVTHYRVKRERQTIDFWLAVRSGSDLPPLPLRVRISEDGSVLEQTLDGVK